MKTAFSGLLMRGRNWRRSAPLALVFCLGAAGGIVLDRKLTAPAPSLAKAPAAGPDFHLLAEAWRAIHHDYVDQSSVHPRKLTYAAISGMVDALGDTEHSTFLTPDMVRDERAEMEGEFSGIGAWFQARGRQIVVASLTDDAPAQKAGLQPGDVVVRVAGRSVAGMTPDQVEQLVRGPAGTRVSLALRSPQSAGIRHFNLMREEIGESSVAWQLLPGTRIAQVQISAFSAGTSAKLVEALAAVRRSGATGLILDLRDNPGGYLSEAAGVASQFLERGNVVLEKDAKGTVKPLPVQASLPKCKLPMVVLVNYESASASEIVSGALQDAKRALLVGEKTLGIGTILTEFQLSDGSALMLAIEEWLTPSGKTIWHQGIMPDVEVALPEDVDMVSPDTSADISPQELQASGDRQLLQALELLQGDGSGAAPPDDLS